MFTEMDITSSKFKKKTLDRFESQKLPQITMNVDGLISTSKFCIGQNDKLLGQEAWPILTPRTLG